jgi:glycosyltransferase involved in cell wall biosynthesis/2-polyprenyl-3-methyl-5-hydroxy-6-metoxy-1,4-benzoquinol methylase
VTYVQKKKSSFDIVMYVPGLPFGPNTLGKHSLGGSETAGLQMAKVLAKLDNRVTMFCNLDEAPGSGDDGVLYLPLHSWPTYVKGVPHDISIVQRLPEAFAARHNALVNVLWCHDMALGRQSSTFRGSLWNVDRVFVLSEYMREQYKRVYAIDDRLLYKTRNGIDLSMINAKPQDGGLAPTRPIRKPKQLVYAARPERGLDVLFEKIMPALLKKDPEITLVIAGYNNPVDQLAELYGRCEAAMRKLGKSVTHVGALTKEQLYNLYRESTLYVYPTPSPTVPEFVEISCISAMEAQACGLPVLTVGRGALPETLAAMGEESCIPFEDGWEDVFVQRTLGILNSDLLQDNMSYAGVVASRNMSWDSIGVEWCEEFERVIAHNNPINTNIGKARLLRHYWRQSDVIAAKEFVKDSADYELTHERALFKDWSFTDQPDGYREQYKAIGATHESWVIDAAPAEPRFNLVKQWLTQAISAKNGPFDVLDYGCAHGAYATRLAEALPDLSIKGVDIDSRCVSLARGFADQLKVADRATFEAWPDGIPEPLKLYDAVLAQEVLEHVPAPWAVVEGLEKHVKNGGFVYITVPFGPWEYSSYFNNPHRNHIWHFSRHDMEDMFFGKPDLVIDAYYHADSPELGDALGWWIVHYRADGQPIGKIDFARKARMQRPRQTVSAQILGGGETAGDTLRWTLRSLEHIADEVIIVDCGMSQETRELVLASNAQRKSYNIRIVGGPDPKREGFERARNAALDSTSPSMDWVFWIDSDEKIINGSHLQKYIRENSFKGYGIRQHHFAVDTTFPPDMPVRLFRRRPTDEGKQMRFFGAIHEHPELVMNEGPGTVVVLSDVHIAHVGYLVESTRQSRFQRNFPLLKLDMERYPTRLLQKHFIMRDNIHLIRFALQQNGGVVNEDIKTKCRENVALYREYFLGKQTYMNNDSITYYSEALSILGEGFDVMYQFEADKVDAKPNGGPKKIRFASIEDAQKEMAQLVLQKAGRFESKEF